MLLIIFLNIFNMSCVVNNQNKVNPFLVDSLVGDWQGSLTFDDGNNKPLFAQVISYGNEGYHINLLNEFDSRSAVLDTLKGSMQNGFVEFAGGGQNTKWEGKIKGKSFEGVFMGPNKTATFSLQKTVRLSPTLGKPVPKNGVSLFNGNNLENWSHVPAAKGYVDLAKVLGEQNCVAYLKSEVTVENIIPAKLLIGSDDGVKVWLNDEIVHANNTTRSAAADQDTVSVVLQKGINHLLLKIPNGDGGWGAIARIVNNNFDPIHDFITDWQIAGPYKEDEKGANELFDTVFLPEMESFKEWSRFTIKENDLTPSWTIIDDILQVKPGSGSLMTKQKFNDFDLHLEFRSPFTPNLKGQSRGNSGVYIQGRYEIQVLDSYGLEGKDNECGGIYKIARPDINMCAPPTQWQTYDVQFRAARYAEADEKLENAQMTVLHNGVIIHDAIEIPIVTDGGVDKDMSKQGPLLLQDHSDLVQYRNIWLVKK